ncbi:hypothetical protein EZ449_12285 [Pedobacter frigidisoli]|uniref:Uncharacterized protein n=1 Tax=Pedobacter frigidisoli TaxID=2530455 RepID=A0A4R0P0B2_9SPHI|nr:hypothetical protein [Pedobacter frigidisoli]TCD08611.1 hypothetical protein EZ449_12285 [Pedobacter frigidisoli]
MLDKINLKYKRLLLFLAMFLVTLLAYNLSFKQALSSIVLHQELSGNVVENNFEFSAFPQIVRKDSFYSAVLKGYQVRKEDPDNRLWQAVSGMAISKKVLIGFSPELNKEPDTNLLDSGLLIKKFLIKGGYFNMVGFLDTLGQSRGNGKVLRLKLSPPKERNIDAHASMLEMSLTLIGKTL